jgi:hypothetical protein
LQICNGSPLVFLLFPNLQWQPSSFLSITLLNSMTLLSPSSSPLPHLLRLLHFLIQSSKKICLKNIRKNQSLFLPLQQIQASISVYHRTLVKIVNKKYMSYYKYMPFYVLCRFKQPCILVCNFCIYL